MNLRTQKIISSFSVSLVAYGGFAALVYVLNLNQPSVYLQLGWWIYAYLMFKIVFLYDLHFKKPGSFERARLKHASVEQKLLRQTKVVISACGDRLHHLRKWGYLKHWLPFLVVPTFIYWSTLSLFFVNVGNLKIQELIGFFSGLVLTVSYWFLKEVFRRGKEVVDNDIFAVLSAVKIYAAASFYAGALSILRYYCLRPFYFVAAVFGCTFFLIYLAMFLHKRINIKNTAIALLIAAALSVVAYWVYSFWGYNYFTAAVFLTALYNLMWSVFHQYLHKILSWRGFWETVVVCLIVAAMVFSVTNFKARILNDCEYFLSS